MMQVDNCCVIRGTRCVRIHTSVAQDAASTRDGKAGNASRGTRERTGSGPRLPSTPPPVPETEPAAAQRQLKGLNPPTCRDYQRLPRIDSGTGGHV